MTYPPLPGPRPGPLQTVFAALGTVVLVLAGFFFGFFVLVTVFGLLLLAAVVFRLRVWWLRRQMERAVAQSRPARRQVIEGEVVHHGRSGDPWRDDC